MFLAKTYQLNLFLKHHKMFPAAFYSDKVLVFFILKTLFLLSVTHPVAGMDIGCLDVTQYPIWLPRDQIV